MKILNTLCYALLRGVKTHLQVATICTIAMILGGCAAGKLFMAGYQPPQTIADLLNEQHNLAGTIVPNGISGLATREQNRSRDPIGRSSYKDAGSHELALIYI